MINTTRYKGIFTTYSMYSATLSGHGMDYGIGIGFGYGIVYCAKILAPFDDVTKYEYIASSPASYSFSTFSRILIVRHSSHIGHNDPSGGGNGFGDGEGYGTCYYDEEAADRFGVAWCTKVVPIEAAIDSMHN